MRVAAASAIVRRVENVQQLELDAWRAVGDHRGDLGPILAHVSRALAASSARVWRLTRDEATPVAEWFAEDKELLPPLRVRVGTEEHDRDLAFLAAEPIRDVREDSAPPGIFHLTGRRGGLIAGLHGPVGAEGALVLTFDGAASAKTRALAAAMVAPIATAYAHACLTREITALEASKAQQGTPRRKVGDDGIIGASGGLRHALERVAQVARTDLPVVLLGETGTGKEVVARAVHDASVRVAGPFHRVNCGAISPELIDSELFGHERGSFTGASAQRQGWFARADGGTLFLDEIAELPLPAQVRLLRVLQDGTFERVGGDRTVRVDVRVIAATHRNLVAMVASGRFRQDLWFRIAAFVIDLPPLRDRAEDMPALASHFAARAAARFGMPMVTPSAEDLAILVRYSWPGNVRELAAVIDRAVLLGAGTCLRVDRAIGVPVVRPVTIAPPALPDDGAPPFRPPAPDGVGAVRAERGDAATLDVAMATHIRAALQTARGRVDGPFGAAGRLGITPSMLRARMKKLGIDWRSFRG